MSTATTTETALTDGLGAKLRKTLIGAGFAVILLIPKVLRLRRDERSWVIFRLVLGVFGAALVILPIGFFGSYFLAVAGLVMFIVAILLPPPKATSGIDDKARELGALMVVDGGTFQSGSFAVPVQLFVGSQKLWALEADFHPLLVIPVPELIFARAEELDGRWILRLRWADRSVLFSYSGVFAENLARAAESTVQSVMHPSVPVLPQRRAASA
ncbi:MAG TPA: hypothetical protein VK818_00085 [Methylomirabilota bacterium]|jgi:hypothetical protein|nr:hypothetical protein [Methylomirabilota bacterium]